MSLMLALLALFQAEKKADLQGTRLYVYDSEKGITLRVREEGRVELSVKEEKGEKTYAADSAPDFVRKYPDVVKKHGLGTYLRAGGGTPQEEFEKLWDDLRNRRFLPEMPEFKPFDGDLDKFLEDQRRRYEDLRKDFQRRFVDPPGLPAPAPPAPPAPPSGGREFGVKIDSVGETLRDQLSLKEGEGVLIGEVKPGSVAERSGLKQHDIILKLDGHAVGDKWQFRKDVLKALEKAEFEVEVIRGGKPATLKAKPVPGKED